MNRRLWALVASLTFIGYLLLHLPTSDLFDGMARRFGFIPYDRATRVVFAAAGVLLWAWLWQAPVARRAVRRSLLVITLVLGYALGMLAVNGIEAIHLPQYVVLVLMLTATGLSLEPAWLVASVLGAADELWQWQLLRRARPEYFDWNDVVLNAIGAAIGVLIARRCWHRDGRLLSSRTMVALLIVSSAAALVTGPIVGGPFYRFSPAGRWFHLASAFEALLLMTAVWWAVRGAGGGASGASSVPPATEVEHALAHRPQS